MSNNLFDQLTAQVNFLLLSQRNMILISAFSVALASFKSTFSHPLMKYFVVILFVYALAVGAKSAEDFNAYIKDTRNEGGLDSRDLNVLDRYETWVYFSYTLLGIIVLILLTFTQIEFFSSFHYFFGIKQLEEKKKSRKKKIN